MARCLVSFGANLGDPRSTIRLAAKLLRERIGNGRFELSRFYRTPPVGGPAGQPPFYNAVAMLETAASVWDVWHCIRNIEAELGRVRNQRWEARPIDLDMLLYDRLKIWTPHLKVPHPRMCMRRFILLPALDVAADVCDPVSGWTVAQLANNVRSGPGSFVLLADARAHAIPMLAEVARRASAEWTIPAMGTRAVTSSGQRRRVGLRELESLESLSQIDFAEQVNAPEYRMTIVLTPPVASQEAAWEDRHRVLARNLNLTEHEASPEWLGPRYLLDDEDRRWVLEELSAALDAMDCPVEAAED